MGPTTEIRLNADTGWIAIRTGPSVTVGTWFVFHPDNGGHYSDGVREKVDDWPVIYGG